VILSSVVGIEDGGGKPVRVLGTGALIPMPGAMPSLCSPGPPASACFSMSVRGMLLEMSRGEVRNGPDVVVF
jgi:hypothetical protein